MTAVARLDLDTVEQWLTLIHGQSVGAIWLGSSHDRFKGRALSTSATGWIRAAVRYVEQLDRTGTPGIYLRTTTLTDGFIQKLRANPREAGRGGDDDSLSLPGLAADLDIAGPGHKGAKPLPPNPAEAKRIIDESGLPDPSIWVHSGGGLYAWWLLDRPHTIGGDLARIKRLAARWQDPIAHAAEQLGYSHGRLGDLARILRIPGTVNRKPAMPEPRPCRILRDTGRRYSLDNLRECLTDVLAAMPAPEPVRVITRTIRGGFGGDDPVAEFEASVDWAQILEPHGWTFAYEHGGARYWCRPGKHRRDGTSATTGRAKDRDRMYVFTDATPLPQNEPSTKFHVYAVLEHGGNHGEALRALRRLGYGGRRVGQAAA